MTFRVTEEERDFIRRRQEQSGIRNMRQYLLKMAVDGRVIRIEFESVNEMVRLLSNATNNINQIARRANETGNIYAADFDEINVRLDEIWSQAKSILRRISDMMDAIQSGIKIWVKIASSMPALNGSLDRRKAVVADAKAA